MKIALIFLLVYLCSMLINSWIFYIAGKPDPYKPTGMRDRTYTERKRDIFVPVWNNAITITIVLMVIIFLIIYGLIKLLNVIRIAIGKEPWENIV